MVSETIKNKQGVEFDKEALLAVAEKITADVPLGEEEQAMWSSYADSFKPLRGGALLRRLYGGTEDQWLAGSLVQAAIHAGTYKKYIGPK